MKRTGIKRSTKPMRKRSPKRVAYMASQARQDGLAHMGKVKALPCCVCGAHGVDVHHLPHPRDDMRTIPLCPFHHRAEYGPQSYHYSRKNFNLLHGSDEELLEKVYEMLDK